MPENNNDWFIGRTTGQISGGFADIKNTYGDTKFSLASKDHYMGDENIQNRYKEQYGDEWTAKFDEDYNVVAKNYQEYSESNFDATQMSKRTVSPGMGGLFDGMEVRKNFFTQRPEYGTMSGAEIKFGEWTNDRWDPREKAIKSRKWLDDKGVMHDMPKYEDVKDNSWLSFGETWGTASMAFNENYTNDQGKQITGWVYDPQTLDPHYRGPSAIQAVYEGEYRKYAGHQYVSGYDYEGMTSMDMEGDWYDAIPRTLNNAVVGMYDAIGTAVAGGASMFGWESGANWVEDAWLSSAQYGYMSSAKNTEENMFGTMDGFLGFAGDVFVQLATGKAAGTLAMKGAGWLGASMKGMSSAAKYGSTTAMMLYGGKDMYRNAQANGFTPQEAGFLYALNLSALWKVNRTFNWLDDTFAATKLLKKSSGWVDDNLAYIADDAVVKGASSLAKNATDDVATVASKEAAKSARMAKFANNMYYKAKNYLIESNVKGGIKGYTNVMAKEAAEEMAEMFGEETVKQAANFYVWSGLAGREYGEEGKGRFKDIFDKGYWEEFGEGLVMSAAGGMLGGAGAKFNMDIGKKFFNSNQQSDEIKDEFVDMIFSGDGDVLLNMIDTKHKEGLMGPSNLSTTWDEKSEAFLSMDAAGENAISMSDANKQILLHQYNYINKLVTGLGSKSAYNNFIEKYPEMSRVENVELVKDVRALTKEYVEIASKNDAEENQVKKEPEGFDEWDDAKKEEWKDKQSRENGISRDVSDRLIEIKTRLDEIQSGKAASKYFIQSQVKDTIFDIDSPKSVGYEHLGPDFLYNMMEASSKKAKEAEDKAAAVKEASDLNDERVNKLKSDLTNIDELLAIFDGDNAYFSDEAKDKVLDLVDNYKIDKENLESLKDSIRAKVTADGAYDASTIIESDEYKAITAANPKLAENSRLAKFAEEYYKTRLETQLDSIKTAEDIDTFKVESVKLDQLLKSISEISSENSKLARLVQGNLSNALTDIDPVSVITMGQKIGKIIGKDPEGYDTISANIKLSNIKGLQGDVKEALGDFAKLKDLASSVKAAESEEDFIKPSSNVDYLLNGFSGDTNSITDEGDLLKSTNGLLKQYRDSELAGEGTSTFANLEETEAVLKQVRARKAQIETIFKITQVESPDGKSFSMITGIADGLADFSVQRARINNAKIADDSEKLFNEAIKEGEKDKWTKLFNKTSVDPVGLKKLMAKKEDGTITEKEQEELTEKDTTLTNMSNAAKTLEAAEARLVWLKGEAESNLKEAGAEENHRQSMAKAIIRDAEVVRRLMESIGLDEKDLPEVKAFLAFESNYVGYDQSDEGLIGAAAELEKGKAILNKSLEEEDKDKALEKYFNQLTYATISGKDPEARTKFTVAALALYVDQEEFQSGFKAVLESPNLEGVPTTDQELVSLAVVGHMMSSIANKVEKYVNPQSNEMDINDVMFVSGLQGTGKSTYVLGAGVKIGQAMQAKQFGKDKSKVLLASNTQKQVGILANTAREYGIDIKKIGASDGVFSDEEKDGSKRPNRLIELLKKNKDLDDVSTIVYDEATFIEYNDDKNTVADKNKTDLATIMSLIKKINNNRDGITQPKLKLILAGDENQNGHTSKQGVDKNIGGSKAKFFATPQLTYSHRSRVTALTEFTGELSTRKFTGGKNDAMTGLKSNYGFISGRSDELYGGIKFRNPSDDTFNDPKFIANIEKQIKISEAAGETFEIGIILSKGSTMPDSAMKELVNAYPNNFTVTDHKAVQGDEFDYVVGVMTKAEIENSKNDWKGDEISQERASAKLLSTTIGRAKYFATIINETERTFESEEIDTISLRSNDVEKLIVGNIKKLKIKMISGDAMDLDIDSIKKSNEDIKKENEIKKEEQAKIASQVEIETAEEKNDGSTAASIESETLESLFNILHEDDQAYANSLDKEKREAFIVERAKDVAFDKADPIIELAAAKLALLQSDDVAVKIAAQIKIENPESTAFSEEEVERIKHIIDTSASTTKAGEYLPEWTADIIDIKEKYDAEIAREDNSFVNAETNDTIDAVSAAKAKEAEKQKAEEELQDIKDRAEITTKDEIKLEEKKEEIIEKIENGEATKEDLSNVEDEIIAVSGTSIDETQNLGEDEDSVANALDQAFTSDIDESTVKTKKDLEKEAKDEMIKMEEYGYIAAYSHNTGEYNGMKGVQLDFDALSYLYDKDAFVANENDYRQMQLQAMGLSLTHNLSDFEYKLVGYRRGTYVGSLFVATERSTGKKVIVGGLYQAVEMIKSGNIGSHVINALQEAVNEKGGMVEIPINNPKRTLNLSALSPGKLVRANQNVPLSEFFVEAEAKGLNVSKTIFVSTKKFNGDGTLNPYRGEAFLLYSFNGKEHNFNARDIDNLIKRGINLVDGPVDNNGKPVLKGFKDGIGIIRLDNRPSSLVELNNIMADTATEEAANRSKMVNPNKGQTRLVTALAQMRVALGELVPNLQTPPRITNFLANNDPQFNKIGKSALNSKLKSWKRKDPDAFNAFKDVIISITKEENLGMFEEKDGSYVTDINSKGERYPIVAKRANKNVVTILNGSDIDKDVKDEVRFELDKFLNLIRVKARLNGDIDPNNVAEMFDNILKNTESFKEGLYMRPTAVKEKYDNNVFAKVDMLPGMTDNYSIKVDDIQTPMIRIKAEDIIDLINNRNNVKPEEKPKTKFSNWDGLLSAAMNSLLDEDSIKVSEKVASSTSEADLEKAIKEMDLFLSDLETRIKDYRGPDRADIKNRIKKLKESFEMTKDEAWAAAEDFDTDPVVDNSEILKARAKELVTNDSVVEIEKAAVKREAEKGGYFMSTPTGAETKLTEDQWLYARTPTFKEWVGDWETKDTREINTIIDKETGEPKLFYATEVNESEGVESKSITLTDIENDKPSFIKTQATKIVDAKSESLQEALLAVGPLAEGQDSIYVTNTEDSSSVVIVQDSDKVRVINNDGIIRAEVDPEVESSEMVEYKKTIADIANKFIQMSEFIYSAEDLNNFKDDLEEAITSTEAQVAAIIEEGTATMDKVELVVNAMKKQFEKLDAKVAANAEDLRTSIELSLKRTYDDNQIPALENSSDNLNENRLSELLIKYHTSVKAGTAELTSTIRQEIGKRYLGDAESEANNVIDEMLAYPELSLDEFRDKSKALKSLLNKGLITKDAYKAAISTMASRVDQTKEIERISSMVAEGTLTSEELLNLKESDFKVLLEDSLVDTIDDSLSEPAQKIINSTWGEVEKFLLLPLDNSAAVDVASRDLGKAITKADAKFNAMSKFVVNEDKKAVIMKEYEDLKAAVIERVTQASIRTAEATNNADRAKASVTNLVPTFIDKAREVALDSASVELLENLEDSDKATWAKVLNGEMLESSSQTEVTALLFKIKRLNPEVFKTIKKFATNKTKDSVCKNK